MTAAKVDSGRATVFADLVETDEQYFASGADVSTADGFSLAVMPGLSDLPAGCVGIRVDSTVEDAGSIIDDFERRVAAHRAQLFRLYVDSATSPLARAMVDRGYALREEVVLFRPLAAAPSRVQLHEVLTDEQWAIKDAVDAASAEKPDGHHGASHQWIELELRKWRAGDVRFFVAEFDGTVCGSVGMMAAGSVCRLKNLLVNPQWRNRGIGYEISIALADVAAAEGCGLGVYAIPGTPGSKVYARAGFRPLGSVWELCRAAG